MIWLSDWHMTWDETKPQNTTTRRCFSVSNSDFNKGSLWLRVAHLDEVSVEQIVVLVKKTCGRKTKTNASVCVGSTKSVSKLYISLLGRQTWGQVTCLFTAKAKWFIFDIHYPCSIYIPLTFRFCFLSRGQRSLATVIYGWTSSYRWHYNWPPQHNAAAWTPPCSTPCGFFHLRAYGWKTEQCIVSFSCWGRNQTWKLNQTQDYMLRDKMRVVAQRVFQFFQKGNIAGLTGSQALFILQLLAWFYLSLSVTALCSALITTHLAHQNGNDAFVLLLYQVTDDFVVKVIHRLPLRHNIWQRKCGELGGKY